MRDDANRATRQIPIDQHDRDRYCWFTYEGDTVIFDRDSAEGWIQSDVAVAPRDAV